jgi:beta-phosphoglucomutase family hydrolase
MEMVPPAARTRTLRAFGTPEVVATEADDSGPSATLPVLVRVPDTIRACLLDMDGVLTDTASTHARAWKQTFDEFLERRGGQAPFDLESDYKAYVDGKTRYDGVRDFLASRGIELPEGTPDDPAEAESVAGVGNRKNELVQRLIADEGVTVYEGSVRFVEEARRAGLKTAVVSSSANTEQILEAAGMSDLFDERVDGVVLARENLPGKPAPDSFLRAAELLGVDPKDAVVYEDALAGVEAGHAGGFGLTVGVDRQGRPDELRKHGADVVVKDLGELLG